MFVATRLIFLDADRFPLGADFNYENAFSWYDQLDKLIHYMNKRPEKISFVYSNPQQYGPTTVNFIPKP